MSTRRFRTRLTTAFAAALMLALTAAVPAAAQLPNPGLVIDPGNTALVITDPQNDFLSPKGVTWGVVGASVTENHTVDHLETLFKTAKAAGLPVFVRRITTTPPTIAGGSRGRSRP